MKTPHALQTIIAFLLLMIGLLTVKRADSGHYHRSGAALSGARWAAAPSVGRISTAGSQPVARPSSPFPVSLSLPAGRSEEKGEGCPSAPFDYALGNARLVGGEGSLSWEAGLTITGLDTAQLPPLETGMVNVTGEHNAFRMSPHGMRFDKNIDIILPYDASLLPMGYTPQDITTYYYDEERRRWTAIERDTVDIENSLVHSKVDHFTDFINAVVKVPEMPETQSHTPTSMSDLKAADPLSTINLMRPPAANNSGTATLDYPLELPAGRQGMQPRLSVTYNSGGGNGWMGVGWDIPIPAITVETRWGVPHYDADKESEGYLLNGEQLATKDASGGYDPLSHRAPWPDRVPGDARYHPRTEGAFQKIIRHGSSPKDYWWEVTDKDGARSFYGSNPAGTAFDVSATLRDLQGNIAKWGLTLVMDRFGNTVCYKYDVAPDTLVEKHMHISEICYTGHNGEPGKYKVEFLREDRAYFNCKDRGLNGRYGLVESSGDLLAAIKVKIDTVFIRGYAFCYKPGGFGKALLKCFGELTPQFDTATDAERMCNAADMPAFVTHSFTYHNQPEAARMFGDPVAIPTGDDNAGGSVFPFRMKATSLGGTSSRDWSVGGAATVGLGLPATKGTSAGGSYTHNRNTSEGLLTIMDLNGDGLPDKLFRQDGKLYYRKQYWNANTNGYEFSSTAHVLPGLMENEFLREKSRSNNWGIEGHLTVYGVGATASKTWTNGKSSTGIYVSDVDGDGLPDIVNNGVVFFNRLDAGGDPTFNLFTTSAVMVGGSCDSSAIFHDTDINERIFHPGDTVVTASYHSDHNSGGYGPNLVSNGNFELGNTGFHTDYAYTYNQGLSHPNTLIESTGTYDVLPGIPAINQVFRERLDHTCGDSACLFFAAHGSPPDAINHHFNRIINVVWEQTVPVEPNTNYLLSAWGCNLLGKLHFIPNPASLRFSVNGNNTGQEFTLPVDGNDPWQEFTSTWNSGDNATAKITIKNTCSECGFGLDDISFRAEAGASTATVRFDTLITPGRYEYMPDHDAVRMWVAPYAGEVAVYGEVCLTENLMEARLMTPALDGVKVSVQHNQDVLSKKMLTPHDTSRCFAYDHPVAVNRGDRVYFRLESAESRLFDKVDWIPVVEYTSIRGNSIQANAVDADGKTIHAFNGKEDFLVNPRRQYYMPMDGTISVNSVFTISEPLSDDVMAAIYRNGFPVAAGTFPKGTSAASRLIDNGRMAVNAGDSLRFEVYCNSNVNWSAVAWENSYHYTWTPDIAVDALMDTTGGRQGDPVPTTLFSNIVPHLNNYPQPVSPTYTYRKSTPATVSSASVTGFPLAWVGAVLSIKDAGGRYLQASATLSPNGALFVFPSAKTLHANTSYYMDLYVDFPVPHAMDLSAVRCVVNGNSLPVGIHAKQPDEKLIFGDMHRNWGQFTYRKDPADAAGGIDYIVESRLRLPDRRMTDCADGIGDLGSDDVDGLTAMMDNGGYYDPLEEHFLMMEPDYPNKRWTGYGNITYVAADTMANTYSYESETDETVFPVPVTSIHGPVRAPKKQGETSSSPTSIGVTTPVYSFVPSGSSGKSSVLSDFMDMNGDRYPDVLSDASVQYTKPQGGLSPFTAGYAMVRDKVESNAFTNAGAAFGGSFSGAKRAAGLTRKNAQIENTNGGNMSVSTGTTSDWAEFAWADVNGDGLPDRVFANGCVQLNIGYAYVLYQNWPGITAVRKGTSATTSGSAGGGASFDIDNLGRFNLSQTSLSGGYGITTTRNNTSALMADVNGDGLPDLVSHSGNGLTARYNLGAGFAPSQAFCNGGDAQYAVTTASSMNGSLSAGFTLSIIPVKFVFNAQGGGGWGVNRTRAQLVDMDADGYLDHVTSDDIGEIQVRYNRTGKTNLLKSASNFAGGSMVIDYDLSRPSADCPQRTWTMASLDVFDGHGGDGADRTAMEFEYGEPRYDRADRESYGFGTVKTSQVTAVRRYPLRVTTEKYHNTEHMRKGLKYYELLTDGAGNKYVEKEYQYALKEIETGNVIDAALAFCYGEGYPAGLPHQNSK